MTNAEQYALCWGNRSLSEWDSVVGHGIDRKYYPEVTEGNTSNSYKLWKETFYAYLPDEQQPQVMIETGIFTRTYQWTTVGGEVELYVTETTLGGEV